MAMMVGMSRGGAIGLLAAAYFLAAKAGLGLAVVHPYATAVWPPTGIALAAVLVYGRGLWPGVAAGAFLANLPTGSGITPETIFVSSGIAVGNTLEALIGAFLLRRLAGGVRALDRVADVFRFAVFAAGISTATSALIGVATLVSTGLADLGRSAEIALTWWIGDAGGNLIVAPTLILWMSGRRPWRGERKLEALAAAISTLSLALIAFTPLVFGRQSGLELAFLCTPALLWIAFRLGRLETAMALLLADAVAIWAWMYGMGSGGGSTTTLLELQGYMGVTSVVLLAVAAEVHQGRENEARIETSERELRLVTDDAPVYLAHCDKEGRYRFVNQPYAERFGLRPKDIIGKHIREVIGNDAYDKVRGHIETVLQGERVEFEQEVVYPKLGTRAIRCLYAPIRSADGSIEGLIAVIADLTAQKRAESGLGRELAFRRAIEEAMPTGVAVADHQGRQTYVNEAFCHMVGYEREDLVGRFPPFVYWAPEEAGRIQAAFEQTLRGAAPKEGYQLRFRNRTGELLDVLVMIAPAELETGEPNAWVACVADITERKYNEARYQAVFATTQDAILIVNDEGLYVDVNQSLCDLLQKTREELIGSRFAPYIPADRMKDAEDAFRTLVTTGRYEGEFPLRAADGTVLELEWRSIGNFVPGLHYCIARDVRERNRFQLQLQQTAKLESLGVVASGIAHDFNNLLVGILGNASLMKDQVGDGLSKALAEDVISAAERAAQLTRQLLAYAGKESLRPTSVDLNLLIEQIVPLIRMSIPKTVMLDLRLREGLPSVEADQTQIQQVVMNLVINAAEAIPDGQSGTVTVRTTVRRLDQQDVVDAIVPVDRQDAEYLALTVSDTGCGMSAEVQRKIFDPFFTTKFAGRGLGLAAVLGIVRSHRGSITLRSDSGEGATFTVLLPVATHARLTTKAEYADQPANGTGTVLVVDDEQTVRTVAKRALERRGYKILVAENGLQAIELLEEYPEIAAVLLDLAMPVMTGDKAAEQIHARWPGMPIILSSGYAEVEAKKQFSSEAVSAFLQKPYTADGLAAKVASVCRRARNVNESTTLENGP